MKQYTQTQKIAVVDLCYDSYQRPLKEAKVKRIIKNYDRRLVNQPKVSYRNGKYWVFDGQHTVAALTRLRGNKDFKILCTVFHGLTKEEEAELFALQNGEATPVTRAEKLHALEDAKNPAVLSFLSANRDCGFPVIGAHCTAFDCFSDMGDEAYRRMLSLIRATWDGEKWSVTQNMLNGMKAFLQLYGDEISDKLFVERLNNVESSRITRAANSHEGFSAPVRFARAIAEFYNYRARNRLDVKKLIYGEEGV